MTRVGVIMGSDSDWRVMSAAAEVLSELKVAHEVRILFLCAQGLTRQEIADALGCSIETVKSHLRNTYRKLGARNRAHALALATERGYLS